MCLDKLYTHFLEYRNISIDSRDIKPGDIFFGIQGKNFNGGDYAKLALEKGASLAIINNVSTNDTASPSSNILDSSDYNDPRIIQVEDTISVLQDLAQKHRGNLSIPVIAITGSCGKTTTKELIHNILSTKYKVYCTKGNRNSHIGLPLSILEIPEDTQIAILEMGARGPGEIKQLCHIAQPTHGLITNIKEVHLEGFKNLEGVLLGKTELYDYLKNNNGTIFVNSLDKDLVSNAKGHPNVIMYSQKGDFSYCVLDKNSHNVFLEYVDGPPIDYDVSLSKNDFNSENKNNSIKTNILGDFNINNINSAYCVSKYFEIGPSKINKTIADYKAFQNRLEIIDTQKNKILLDAYNSNYESLIEAINLFRKITQSESVDSIKNIHDSNIQSRHSDSNIIGPVENTMFHYEKAPLICKKSLFQLKSLQTLIILGDMLELAEKADEYHKNIISELSKDVFTVFFCGSNFYKQRDLFPAGFFFENKESLVEHLSKASISQSVILIKGSRHFKFESLIDIL